MSLTLIAVANRGDVIELTYEETVGDPHPFVLTPPRITFLVKPPNFQ